LARNNKIFQNKEIPANETVGKAIEILQNYKLNSNPDQITSTRVHPSTDCNNSSWSPPPRASIKLNVVAHLCSDGRLGLGLVLRDEDGRVVGAATRVQNGSGNVELPETLGLVEALKLINTLKLRAVIVEMDSAMVVCAIQNKSFPRNQWGQLAQRCDRVLKEEDNISLCCISRAGNEAAHLLARWAITEPNRYWAFNFPLCITQQVQKDLQHVTRFN
jgi:ribonuclease HI